MNSVKRIFNVLEVLAENKGGLSLSELSKLSKVSIATTYRICSELVNRGYLKKESRRGKYSLGIKFLEFNAVIQQSLNIVDISLPFLERLSGITGEYSEVAILHDYAAVTVAQVDVAHNLKILNIVGERLPLHATSVGKILLAYMSVEGRKIFYEKKLKRLTEKTLTEGDQLEQEVEKVRQNGYALDDEENDVGIWSAAAPIYDFNNLVIAGLALAVPSVRINDKNNQEFISIVKRTSSDISEEMGYKRQLA